MDGSSKDQIGEKMMVEGDMSVPLEGQLFAVTAIFSS